MNNSELIEVDTSKNRYKVFNIRGVKDIKYVPSSMNL